jgi:hypothetical protein
LQLFRITEEVLFRKVLVVHADFGESAETFLETQVLEGAILEGSWSEELFEVVFFSKH